MTRGTVSLRRSTLWAVLALAAPLPVTALQEVPENGASVDTTEVVGFPEGVAEVDRVIAVVGDTAILMSELRMTMFQLQAGGARIPPETAPEWTRFARDVLAAQVDDLIFIQQAKRTGLTPDADRVDEVAEDYFQQTRSQFASDEEMMQAVESSGMNMLQYRQLLRGQAQAQALRQEYRFALERRTDLPTVIVSEEEIEAAFDEFAANQPPRPALVSFNQIVVTPSPSGEARDSANVRTILVQNDLANEVDFSVIARRYSDDETTREQGGELGWMNQDLLVKPFADAAWRARPGQTIGPIQTQFGLHFIRVERQRGSERFLRHVLLRPDINDEDLELARTLAVEVADSLRAGVDPEALVGYFRGRVADEDIRFDDIPVQNLMSQFQGDDATILTTPPAGTVYGPLAMQRGGPTEYGVIHVLTYRPEGPVELSDVRDAIRRNLRIAKQIDILLAEVRANTFIDVKL